MKSQSAKWKRRWRREREGNKKPIGTLRIKLEISTKESIHGIKLCGSLRDCKRWVRVEIVLHDDSTKKQVNLIISNTDEGKRDAQTRVEGNRLIVSNTDELGYERGIRVKEKLKLKQAWMKKQANLIVSNTDEGIAQTTVENNRLTVSNTDELGGGGYEKESRKLEIKQTTWNHDKQTNHNVLRLLVVWPCLGLLINVHWAYVLTLLPGRVFQVFQVARGEEERENRECIDNLFTSIISWVSS